MMKKCNGCGAVFQSLDSNLEGYIKEENILKSEICERCFRIKNYGDYKFIDKNNIDFINILKNINLTNDLVVLVVDIFNVNKDLVNITKYLKNDLLLVFTKKDILPLKVTDDKLLSYNEKLKIKCVDSIIISSNKNYSFDLLFDKINMYKKTKNVYVVGYTNAGKSTMINKLIYNYSDSKSLITTSILPSTTISTIEIKLNDELTIIDTPGVLDNGSIINYVDSKTLKKIVPKKEIKPVTYQIKTTQNIIVEDLLKVESSNNNLTFYVSNDLKIDRYYKNIETNLIENIVRVNPNNDIVISGLGFIRVSKKEIIKVYTLENVDVYVRESLI